MQTEARVGVVIDGGVGQRAFDVEPGQAVVDGGAAGVANKLMTQPKESSLGNQQSHIGTVSQLLAGGIAGAVGKTCTAPLARLTILFQVQGMHSDAANLRKACIWQEARRVIKEEGFRAFWKGNLVTIAHRLPYSAISFCTFETSKNSLQSMWGLETHGEHLSTDVFVRLLGGGLAGITAASVTYPLDLVRTRLATQTNVSYYSGIFHALRTICRDEGAFGLYKGLGATLLGVGPNLAISFSVYDTGISLWKNRRPNDSAVLVSLGCGSLSGIVSSTGRLLSHGSNIYLRLPDVKRASLRYASQSVTFPLDLVRRRMQLEGVGGRARVYKNGLFGTFKQIFQSEGLRGLYRGILPEYYKVVPSVSIVFMTYEILKQLMSDMP